MPSRNWYCQVCRGHRSRNTRPAGETRGGGYYCGTCAANDDVVNCAYDCPNMIDTNMSHQTNDDGDAICQWCWERTTYCTNCDEDLEADDVARQVDDHEDRFLCRTCWDDCIVVCNACEKNVMDTVGLPQTTQDVCFACAKPVIERKIREYNDCGCDEHIALLPGYIDLVFVTNAFEWQRHSWQCTECGRRSLGFPDYMTPRQKARYLLDRTTDIFCSRCGPPAASGVRAYRVQNYSFKPDPMFKATSRDLAERALHFGTEVEIEMSKGSSSNHVALQQLADADEKHKLFYCKSDASVRTGFELVSHPFTFEWMKDNDEAFQAMFKLGKIMEGWSAVRCGMHVHMSTDAFSGLHLLKFMRFFYENQAFIAAVARRPADRLQEWSRLTAPKGKKLQQYALKKTRSLGLGRSSALNVGNDKTIECRIFRSTLAPTAYYGNIEFLQSLFDYTKGCGLHELQKERFLGFVKERSKAYNNFVMLAETLRPVTVEE